MSGRKGLFSKAVIIFIIASNAAVMAVCLWLVSSVGLEAAALAGVWFAWTTGELWQLARIKKSKVEKESEAEE